MDLLPIEVYLGLVFTIPLTICFAKWRWSLTWKMSAAICAGASWIYFNLWMSKLDPPENGFANAVYLVTGWFWFLPILGVILMPFKLVEVRMGMARRSQIGRYGIGAFGTLSVVLFLWGVAGRMSEERALRAAREELIERGYHPNGRELPAFVEGHWIVRYPDTDFGEIRLTRNGRMSWIGGPG